MSFDWLLSRGHIGQLWLKNRVVMAPINTNLADAGMVSERLIAYLQARARGGVGLIIVEASTVEWPRGKAGTSPPRLDDWVNVPRLHELVDALHSDGAKVAIQLHHTGRQQSVFISEGEEPVAPSAVPCAATGGDMPRALGTDEVYDYVGRYVLAAQRAKCAGFDAVEIHGAHGYLVGQFLSPYSNRRDDEWGGDQHGRLRFATEIVKGVKAACGTDFPVMFRVSGDEYVPGGLSPDDTKDIAAALEVAGVDALHVSAGIYESDPSWFARIFPVGEMPEGCNVELAARIKSAVSVPVIAVGKLGDPLVADRVLSEGHADFVALGRPLLADPDWVRKAAAGRPEQIRPCLYCNECYGAISRFWPVRCQVNPALGREREAEAAMRPAPGPGHVVVVGGGPGGLEAARVAAARGHRVTLIERSHVLGGKLRPAAVPAFKKDFAELAGWLEREVIEAQVAIDLGTQGSADTVLALAPDAVILAPGAQRGLPPSLEASDPRVMTAEDALAGIRPVGDHVLVVGGGGVGCETGWHLAAAGKHVTIVEQLGTLAGDLNLVHHLYVLAKLRELGVRMIPEATVTAVAGGTVTVETGRRSEKVEADAIVVATGDSANNALERSLEGRVPTLEVVGDALGPAKVEDAIHGAFWAAVRV